MSKISTTPELVDSLIKICLTDRRVTTQEISEQLVISVGTAQRIEHYELVFSKPLFVAFHQDNVKSHRTKEITSYFG